MRKNRKASDFPHLPGVYLFKDENGRPIYIGKAKSLKNRVSSYFRRPITSPKTEAIIKNYKALDYIVAASELEALLLENKLIKQYKPKYNVLLKDDKNYPYIKITMGEDWPRILMVRKKENDGAFYFGPYEGKSVKETIKLLARLFFLRTCKESPLKMRVQPCLQYHIKKCWAPCIKGISNEQYRNLCAAAIEILKGNLAASISALKKEMLQAALMHKFEQATKLRNQISGLERIKKVRKSWMPKARVNRGNRAASELALAIGLKHSPDRIEAFDVSNTSGKQVVASMVVFEGGEPLKSDYRKFIIRSVSDQNDFASINEAVYRRYAKTLKGKLPIPDLVLIDGGIPQIGAAKSALARARTKVPLISLAKREEVIYFPDSRPPLKLPCDSKALLLLERIRDEAHRFAVAFHRNRRNKAFYGNL
ncbi:excinuclease ABC subunit UvrC [Candidatus Saganbacteria bacterium]|nr:excinuclease ABC subunit UvrC [Candidatus Saganbacteria bacterium]